MMDPKDMTNEQLKNEMQQASKALSEAESAYVHAQNVWETLETENDIRTTRRGKDVPQKDLTQIIDKWSTLLKNMKTNDDKEKDAIHNQCKLLQICIDDIRKILGY